jgi:hypothetical protein
MKQAWTVAAVVLCLVVSGAWASELNLGTPRSLGMGTTVVGVADDGAAWYQNPAGLGTIAVTPREGNTWGADAIGLYGKTDIGPVDFDTWALTISGRQPEKQWGLGAGLADVEDAGKLVGVGYGSQFRDSAFSWGLNAVWNDPDSADDFTTLNVGLLYTVEQPEQAPIRLGLRVQDVTDENGSGPSFDFGALWPATPLVGLALDVIDFTDETGSGPFFNIGAECALGQQREWTLRAGAADSVDGHDLTLGAGYERNAWRLDFGWADTADGAWSVGGGIAF